MNDIKVLVLCNTRFALASIQQLWHLNMLSAVVVPPGGDDIRENTQALLQGSKIPVIMLREQPEKELAGIIKKYEINLCLMLTFSLKIPSSVYSLPGLGFYNVHPGPLPLYRGADPVFQQIRNREEYAGIAIHRVDKDFDTGPVIMKEKIPLEPEDTYGMVNLKLSLTASKMVAVLVKMTGMGIIPVAKEQNEAEATYYKRQGAAEVTIQWNSMTADEIIALINACNPWNKGAITRLKNAIVRLPEAKKTILSPGEDHLPGTIINISGHEIIIATIEKEAIAVPFICIDEGMMSAGRFGALSPITGFRFE